MKRVYVLIPILVLLLSCVSNSFTIYESNLDKIKNVNGRNIRVDGIVTEGGMGLPAANISVKGTNIQVQANIDGKYTIYVKKRDVLLYEFVGMRSVEKRIRDSYMISADSMHIDVKMPDPILLGK